MLAIAPLEVPVSTDLVVEIQWGVKLLGVGNFEPVSIWVGRGVGPKVVVAHLGSREAYDGVVFLLLHEVVELVILGLSNLDRGLMTIYDLN